MGYLLNKSKNIANQNFIGFLTLFIIIYVGTARSNKN